MQTLQVVAAPARSPRPPTTLNPKPVTLTCSVERMGSPAPTVPS